MVTAAVYRLIATAGEQRRELPGGHELPEWLRLPLPECVLERAMPKVEF